MSKEALAALSLEYLENRNAKLKAQTFMAEVQAGRARGELIPKKAVKDMISYALVCFRQRTLLSYRAITQLLLARNLIATENAHAVSQVILEETHALLNELGRMSAAANPESGLKELEREELGLEEKERPEAPADGKHRQAQAERLRAKKAEAARNLRAERQG